MTASDDDTATADDAVHEIDFCLSNGLVGEAPAIRSANPTNFHQAISDTDAMPPQDLRGKLFVPEGRGPFPVVCGFPWSPASAALPVEVASEQAIGQIVHAQP